MQEPIRLGVCGLGRAFVLMEPTLQRDARVRVVAAAAPRRGSREDFTRVYGGRAYADLAQLCDDPAVEAVYIATPHQLHAEHVEVAAAAGKHVLLEKPLAVTLAEADRIVAAVARAGVQLCVGPSHSFDAPILRCRDLIAAGEVGAPRLLQALNYTDFLYRPRRPEELSTAEGGGVVFSQGAHQVDVARLLCGGLVERVSAATGNWDPARPTEGAYSALLTFAGGAVAALTYSGYGRFDSDEFCNWTGELGQPKNPERYAAARQALRAMDDPAAEAAAKRSRTFNAAAEAAPPPVAHEHFGLLLLSCERAELRPQPDGVWVYGDDRKRFEPMPAPGVPRAGVIDELYAAVRDGAAPLHSAAWGRATLEVCLGILRSAREGREVTMSAQVPAAPGT